MIIVKTWWPTVTWMSIIFLFSTDLVSDANTSSVIGPGLSSLFPSLTSEHIELIHFGVRKLGHWSEYFILARLLISAVQKQYPGQPRRSRLIWSLVLATLYAAGDEWHQSFVPSRSASIVDALIDSFGAASGALWFERRKKNPDSSR